MATVATEGSRSLNGSLFGINIKPTQDPRKEWIKLRTALSQASDETVCRLALNTLQTTRLLTLFTQPLAKVNEPGYQQSFLFRFLPTPTCDFRVRRPANHNPSYREVILHSEDEAMFTTQLSQLLNKLGIPFSRQTIVDAKDPSKSVDYIRI